MNEEYFGYKIRQHLNRGLHQLRPETTARLAAAREAAMACQRQAVSQSLLATVGGFVQSQFDNLRLKQLITALALFVGVVFSAYWVADQRVAELGAIDSALLADDLPISAFTDKGFDAWLKRASPQ
ncbi:MAG: hypothetical protein H6R17_2700 [Proteobacteria bacterium]|nr:hypothetical protein [Pseudomonadota bacterium]